MLALAVPGLVACRPAPSEAPRGRLRIATGTPGAGFYPLGEGLAREYGRAFPNLDVVVVDT